jgi:hypothetical protein
MKLIIIVIFYFLKDDEIPEGELPRPFNKSSELSSLKVTGEDTSMDEPQSVILSHMPPSFQRRFYQKAQFCMQKRPLLDPSSSSDSLNDFTSALEATPTKKLASASAATPAKLVSTPTRLMAATPEIGAPNMCLSKSCVDSPPVKRLESKRSARSLLFMSPIKSIKEKDDKLDNDEYGVLDFLPKSLLQSVRISFVSFSDRCNPFFFLI